MSNPWLALLFGLVLAFGFWREARTHDIYAPWRVPNNPAVSCCSEADCRPTQAFLDDDGEWQAWNGYRWLPVPRERVLPTDYARDGRSHVCEKAGFIYCFSPAEPKG